MREMFRVSSLKGWFTGVHILSVNLECLGYGGCQPAEHAQTFHCISTPSDSLGGDGFILPQNYKMKQLKLGVTSLNYLPWPFLQEPQIDFQISLLSLI